MEPSSDEKGRVWCDGCYDMVHFGHANQLRQAKQFGKKLIVGVHNDKEVTLHKGPPVFGETERYRMVRAIRWVDEVVEDAPYATSVATLDQHSCDFCVHGDDITLTADGRDTYEEVKKAGRYRECKRTAGVSTTDLVGRMLLLTKSHHSQMQEVDDEHKEKANDLSLDHVGSSPWTRVSHFVATTNTIVQFAEGRQAAPGDKIVYVCGSFDLFHIGHLSFLEEAKKWGDYLMVGIFSDQDVNSYKGENHPIMSLHERVLSVLAYRPVDEVIIGAPMQITDEIIKQFNISIVGQGNRVMHHDRETPDPYIVAKRMGIYKEIDSGSDMTTEMIINRIIDHRKAFQTRNKKKEKKEIAAYEALSKMVEGGDRDTTKAVCI